MLIKRKAKTKQRLGTLSSLEKKLDKVFSLYIRQRDSDENGHGRCVTCGKIGHYKEMHCGHFISRRHKATRWDEQNCALQCVSCNTYNQGRQYEFALYIEKKYGKGTAEKLLYKSRGPVKFMRFELEEMIKRHQKTAKTA